MTQISDAYASLDMANKWCLARDYSEWADAPEASRQAVLIRASDWLDQLFSFKGEKSNRQQLRSWPRRNVVIDGFVIDEVTPQAIIDASIELALAMLSSAGEAETLLGISGAVSQERIGSLSIMYDRQQSQAKSRLELLLRPYLRSNNQMQVARS